ncbi:hypothetical protein PV703_04170 [Streptomyces sp. ME01-24h]|jgi:hypothetical protein|nr:hypothetical protein [Streptomyces sp. ME19-03-3]MDX3352532.1 hypothetical protein [Streptomyces sp. ME01-24h]
MDTKPMSYAWIGWAGAALLGMFAGYATWLLVVNARAYCDAGYEAADRFGFLYVELPVSVIGYGLSALIVHAVGRWLTRRAPTALRVCVPALLVVTTLLFLAWTYFRTQGTLDGYYGDSGLCPPSNIPPWWPDWIPA